MDLIAHLKKTLEDDHFSKSEKNEIKIILENESLDPEQLSFIRTKIYELANQKATPANYRFVMEWMKDANNVLTGRSIQQTRVFFSPGDSCRNAIISQINSAAQHLHICVFTISDDLITHSVLNAHRRGVTIRIITDNDKSYDHGSDIDLLAKEGIAVKLDISRNHMHHKFMITDDDCILTGSYNWTGSAARYNHENIILTKESGVVKSFRKEFEKLWKEMTPY